VVSRAQVGVDAPPVTVEVHISGGLPGTTIVGLPEATVREARERVRAAILNAQFEYPCRRVTISLAPADLPKDGGRYDLAIALGVLAASGQIPSSRLAGCEFLGELALSGELRGVTGVLPAALRTRAVGRTLIAPRDNAGELAEELAAREPRARDLPRGREHAERDREVVASAVLRQVRGRERDRHAAARILELRVEDRRAHALARLAHRGLRQADDRRPGQAARDVHFDRDRWRIDADLSAAHHDRKIQCPSQDRRSVARHRADPARRPTRPRRHDTRSPQTTSARRSGNHALTRQGGRILAARLG